MTSWLIWLVISQGFAGKFATDDNLAGLRWRTLETERFRIHYPDSEAVSARHTAQGVAEVAEEILERLEVAQGSHVNETIHVVVLDQDDALSGFTIPQWDWVVISAHPGAELHRTRGRQTWIPDVLAHELAHLVSHKRAGTLAEGANFGLQLGIYGERGPGLAGAKVTLTALEPYWWSEGGAEYLSERAGYNWWSTARDANLRMTVLSGSLLSWRELQVRADKREWNDAERGYQQGYAFARWIDETHGFGTFTEIAEEARKGLGRWDHAVAKVLGEPGDLAYARFENGLRDRYVAQASEVRAQGEVVGSELTLSVLPWDSELTPIRDAFRTQPRAQQEADRRSSGTWNLFGRFSQDGAWFAEHRAGWVRILPVGESDWPALSGEALSEGAKEDTVRELDARGTWLPSRFGYGFDFVPGAEALVMTAEMGTESPLARVPGRPYRWNQLYWVDLSPKWQSRRHRSVKESYPTLDVGTRAGELRRRYRPIPGTQRGCDAAVSPVGDQLAYLQARDGTMTLAVSDLDGSNKRVLSDFEPGTWMQGPDWSPDGRQLVVAVHRTYQQNLWIVDVEEGTWRPLTQDGWEEMDPWWGDDGIYFAADPTGISNIYRWSANRVVQVTHVVGGASTPSLTPEGHLVYSLYTGAGFKSYGLHRDAFLETDATYLFGLAGSDEPTWRPKALTVSSRRYAPLKSLATPSAGPVLRLDFAADGATPRGGGYLKIRDYVEKHDLSLFGLTGRDAVIAGAYTFRGWRPDLQVWGSWESDRRPLLVTDPVLERVWDRRALAAYGGTVSVPIWEGVRLDLGVSRLGLAYASRDDQVTSPILRSTRGELDLAIGQEDASRRVDDERRWVSVGLLHGQSVLPEPERDDGEWLDNYGYNQVRSQMRLTVPLFGGALARHRIDLGWDAAFTDTNVFREEEPRAGGDHAMALRLTTLGPSAPMPGYAPYSLRGEELFVGHLGWRFPVIGAFDHRRGKGGPFLEQLWGRIGTDLGDVWSAKGAREVGRPPVADVSVELRLAASLLDAPWDSSIGVAYGFNSIAIPQAPSEPVAAPLGSDTSGVRVYLNLGAGW
jgi:hypothetical protein